MKNIPMWTEMSNPAILTKIGSRIKEARIRQNRTQADLAVAAGVAPLTIANIEKGKSISTLILIAVLRELGLLENLENLIPETKISPLQLKKIQGKKRLRVRRIKPRDNE